MTTTRRGKSWRSEKLTDRQEVRDARKRQRGHEVRSASIAEVARADRQRHAQRGAEHVHSLRGGDLSQFFPCPSESLSEIAPPQAPTL